MAVADPSNPNPYVGGTITVTAGAAVNLLALIRAQLDTHCPGAGHQVQIYSDRNNSQVNTVKIGNIAGIGAVDVSDTNYGYELVPGGSRLYVASILGANAPLGRLRVFCTSTATLHIEVQA